LTTESCTFILPAAIDEKPFVNGEAESFSIEELTLPADWCEANMVLTEKAGYATTGKLVLFAWQREPINAIAKYDRVIYCGPVQTGKSLISECACWWAIKFLQVHAMYCYAKKETVQDVFQDRIKPTIEGVPALRALWDGDPDNLTQDKIKLRSAIIRVASAAVRSDLATFAAGLIYASEVCKYRELSYDVIKLLRGRQEAYGMVGKKKEILESSPIEEGDILHKEMFKPGVLNLEPYFPCPICGTFQLLLLDNIQEVPNQTTKEKDHNPERIRQEEAAYYSCSFCGNSIQEKDRIEMGERVVWAARGEKISKAGEILTERAPTSAVSFQWSRLVDYSFKFSELLARFYEASRAGDPIKLRTFLNEDMGQFSTIKTEERSSSWLMGKIAKYKISDETIPAGIVVLLAGIDTQDKGFYFVLRGFGVGKESWLLDCDWIPCDMPKDKAPEEVLKVVQDRIYKRAHEMAFNTTDGRELYIGMALWDRGGHKANYVDYCTSRMRGFAPYIGSTGKLDPLIKQSDKNGIYWGNTDNLSRVVDADSVMDNWHLPEDVPRDYITQFVQQYDKEEMDRFGNKKVRRIRGRVDHYRDCENMIQGCVVALGLDQLLFDGEKVAEAVKEQVPHTEEKKEDEPQGNNYFADIQSRWARRG
jgi:phage terminase large subunit GpA-like protein